MAIDTAAKRASVLSFAFVARTLIVPVAGIAQADQQTICHCYGGILAARAAIAQPTTAQLDYSNLLASLTVEEKNFYYRNLDATKQILDAILARLTAAGIP